MSAPAGWHRQDDGRERFWDGQRWTEQYRQAPPPAAEQAPFWRRPWVLTVAGFVLLVIVIGAFADPADETTPDEPAAATTTAAAPATSETTTEPAEPTQEPEPEADVDDAAVTEQIRTLLGEGEEWAPSWVAPITSIEARAGSQIRVAYQLDLTEDDKVQLGQYIHNFVRSDVPDGTTSVIVVTDTSGVDFNVWCGPTICAANVLDTDR